MPKQIISRGGINNKMLIYNSQSFISPIARQYFAKVNALGGDVQDKKAINDFTIGLSRLVDPNLWVCWPLRSSQNIGSGTTVPSLGLLGDFPGTLVNGPTWGMGGVNTNTSGQRITVSSDSFPLDAPCTAFCSFTKLGSLGASNRIYSNAVSLGLRSILWQVLNLNQVSVAVDRSDQPNWQAANFTTPLTAQQAISVSINGDNAGGWRLTNNNNAAISPSLFDNTKPWSAAAKTPEILRHSATVADSSYNTQIILWVSFALSDEQRLSLYTLYKNTLGIGLGLN